MNEDTEKAKIKKAILDKEMKISLKSTILAKLSNNLEMTEVERYEN